jgi:hypothetical protein
VEDRVTYPPAGQPYYPDQNQPQYGSGQSYPPPESTYGSEQSYTTEPPYSGQPYSGSSYPAQPYSAAPYNQGYAQAAPAQQYAQPAAYQASVFPQQTPSFVTPPAQRRGSGGMIALVAGSAVLLLILLTVGGAVLLRSGDDDPTPGNTAAAPASAAPASSTAAAEYPARIDLPDHVAGLSRVVGNTTLDQIANETAAEVKTAANADTAVAAYYAPGGNDMTRAVGLFGATGRITDPKGELDGAFKGEDFVVTGLQDVDPGPLGGYMMCGNTAGSGQALTVCGWADGGSVMIGIFAGRSLTDSASLLRQIRGDILKRG